MYDGAVLPRWRAGQVSEFLRAGAVMAYPTEGVWGLGCLPDLESSVARILALKRRSWEQGLILLASDIAHVEPYLAGLSRAERAELDRSWPSAVTYLVPDNGVAPIWITGRNDKVALRVSQHPVVRTLCSRLGGPIVSTSANPAGRAAALSSLRVCQYFRYGIDLLLPGKLGDHSGASEIRDLRSGTIIRKGGERLIIRHRDGGEDRPCSV